MMKTLSFITCFSFCFQEKGVFSGVFKRANKPAKEASSDEVEWRLIHGKLQCFSLVCSNSRLFFVCVGIKRRQWEGQVCQFWKFIRGNNVKGSGCDKTLFFFSILLWNIHNKCIVFNLYQEKSGGLAGYFKKSPKPAARSVVSEVIK